MPPLFTILRDKPSSSAWLLGNELTPVAPAIETFGTHRIIFGSQPALPPTDPDVIVPISGAAWYTLLRRCVSELGEEHEAMTAIMGVNAVKLYDL